MPRRNSWRTWAAAAACLLIIGGHAAAGPRPRPLQVFQYASPIPSACEAVGRAKQPAVVPFAGIVLDPATSVEQGRAVQFSRGFWGGGPPDAAVLDGERGCLDQIQTARTPLNLVRVAVIPGTIDWFDDWAPIWDRVDLLATFLRGNNMRGIFFDPELYGPRFPVFNYRRQKYASARAFGAYARQAFLRGTEFITRLQRIRPDLVILVAFAFERPWSDVLKNTPLERSPYGLLPAFLNGIIAQAGPQVILIDGYEQAYGFRTEVQFALARQVFDTGVLSLVASPEAYRARFRLGFGIWLNYEGLRLGWSAAAPERNYYSPEAFTNWLTWARRYSDGFAWVYTDRLDWADPAQVPPVYVRILTNFSRP